MNNTTTNNNEYIVPGIIIETAILVVGMTLIFALGLAVL